MGETVGFTTHSAHEKFISLVTVSHFETLIVWRWVASSHIIPDFIKNYHLDKRLRFNSVCLKSSDYLRTFQWFHWSKVCLFLFSLALVYFNLGFAIELLSSLTHTQTHNNILYTLFCKISVLFFSPTFALITVHCEYPAFNTVHFFLLGFDFDILHPNLLCQWFKTFFYTTTTL